MLVDLEKFDYDFVFGSFDKDGVRTFYATKECNDILRNSAFITLREDGFYDNANFNNLVFNFVDTNRKEFLEKYIGNCID